MPSFADFNQVETKTPVITSYEGPAFISQLNYFNFVNPNNPDDNRMAMHTQVEIHTNQVRRVLEHVLRHGLKQPLASLDDMPAGLTKGDFDQFKLSVEHLHYGTMEQPQLIGNARDWTRINRLYYVLTNPDIPDNAQLVFHLAKSDNDVSDFIPSRMENANVSTITHAKMQKLAAMNHPLKPALIPMHDFTKQLWPVINQLYIHPQKLDPYDVWEQTYRDTKGLNTLDILNGTITLPMLFDCANFIGHKLRQRSQINAFRKFQIIHHYDLPLYSWAVPMNTPLDLDLYEVVNPQTNNHLCLIFPQIQMAEQIFSRATMIVYPDLKHFLTDLNHLYLLGQGNLTFDSQPWSFKILGSALNNQLIFRLVNQEVRTIRQFKMKANPRYNNQILPKIDWYLNHYQQYLNHAINIHYQKKNDLANPEILKDSEIRDLDDPNNR